METLADVMMAQPSRFELDTMLRLAALEGWPVAVAAEPSRVLSPTEVSGWRVPPGPGLAGVLVAAVGPVAGRASRLGPGLRRRLASDGDADRPLRDAVDSLTDQAARRAHDAWRRAHPQIDYEAAIAATGAAPGRADAFVAELLGLAPAALASGLVCPLVGAEAAAFAAGAVRRGGAAAFEAAASYYFGVRVRMRPVVGDASRYEIRVGPLRLARYRDFLPPALGGTALLPLLLWARAFAGPARRPRVVLVLRAGEAPAFVARRAPTPDAARAGWLGWTRRPGRSRPPRSTVSRISAATCARLLNRFAADCRAGAANVDYHEADYPGRLRP
jgi:predicted component of type VI protein secretion system